MIVFGKNVAKEVIESDIKIYKVYIQKNFNDSGILNFLDNNNIETIIMDKRDMDLKYKGNHQGIVLDIEEYKYYSLEDVMDSDFIVILDHLEDPHNFGAIIRTCEAAGVNAIIIPKNRSVKVNATVMKVSAGALTNVKIVEVNNIINTIEKMKTKGFWIYGTDMEDSEIYTQVDYSSKVGLVIGAEGNGIGRLIRENCDFIVNIPMVGKINSLNASVAAGIIIYEIVRQRSR